MGDVGLEPTTSRSLFYGIHQQNTGALSSTRAVAHTYAVSRSAPARAHMAPTRALYAVSRSAPARARTRDVRARRRASDRSSERSRAVGHRGVGVGVSRARSTRERLAIGVGARSGGA